MKSLHNPPRRKTARRRSQVIKENSWKPTQPKMGRIINNKASHPLFLKMFYLFLKRLKTKAIPYFRIPNTIHSTEWRKEFSEKTIALYPDLLSYSGYCNMLVNRFEDGKPPFHCGWFHWTLAAAAFVPPRTPYWFVRCALPRSRMGAGHHWHSHWHSQAPKNKQREGPSRSLPELAPAGPRHAGRQFCINVAFVLG